jgi:hypothetical protein
MLYRSPGTDQSACTIRLLCRISFSNSIYSDYLELAHPFSPVVAACGQFVVAVHYTQRVEYNAKRVIDCIAFQAELSVALPSMCLALAESRAIRPRLHSIRRDC